MKPYQANRPSLWKRMLKKALIFLAVCVIVAVCTFAYAYRQYTSRLQPVSNDATEQVFTVEQGSGTLAIGNSLEQAKLIRSSWAFQYYVRFHTGSELFAGTYRLRPNMSVQEIVQVLRDGKVATDLVTILPAQRLDQVKSALIKAGFSEAEVNAALVFDQYADHPLFVTMPEARSLEGFLYPESFQKTATTELPAIIRGALDEMQKVLTPQLLAAYQKQGLSTYQSVIIASIVEQEVSGPDRPQVAQVFLKRFREGMQLGSDVTAFYASRVAGEEDSVFIDSPYNTRLYEGLPPTPIGNVSKSSLEAVANPAGGDYLYFVAGDDGKTYFARTVAEHDQNVAKYCTVLCN